MAIHSQDYASMEEQNKAHAEFYRVTLEKTSREVFRDVILFIIACILMAIVLSSEM